MIFIDEAAIHVSAGRGGSGCVAFRREKYEPRGGPSGGDGGGGGSVRVRGDARLNTLYHLKVPTRFAAERGRHGEGARKSGRSGADLVIDVPLGTVVADARSGERLGELVVGGEELVVARGGRGGKGNAHFATAVRQAPRFAQPGEEGEERDLRLELKLLADVGVVGLPNAGKSTLISVLTAAKPRIADYPFTTLVPQLAVVAAAGERDSFVIADLPGLIAGASLGAGLGHRFLRHVERCAVLVHLVDLASPGSAGNDIAIVEGELRAWRADLLERPRLLVGSKLDAALPERRSEAAGAAAERGITYLEISSASHRGLGELVAAMSRRLLERRALSAAPELHGAERP